MITMTPRAAKKITTLAASQGKPGAALRVKVIPGGCSGMSYSFEFDLESLPGDLVCELEGAKAVTDKKSDLFLSGSVIDYEETMMKSGFEVTNPKAKSTCSCGTSFNTADAEPKEESFSV